MPDAKSGIGRRSFLAQLGLAAGGAALALSGSGSSEASTGDFTYDISGQPNILVIILDQLRYKELASSLSGLPGVLPYITTLQSESIKVNGERIPPELIEEERVRLQAHPDVVKVTDSIRRSLLLQGMSENSAIDRVFLKQEVDKDTDAIPPEWMEEEIAKLQRLHGSREAPLGAHGEHSR